VKNKTSKRTTGDFSKRANPPEMHSFPFVNPVFNHEPSEQISLLNFGE